MNDAGRAATGPGEDSSDAEVVALGWERPQLIVRVRSRGGPLDPTAFRLERVEAPRVVMPPTGSDRNGDLLDLRFNVMVGPGLRPLASGRWGLRMSGPGGRPSRAVRVAESVDPSAVARTFDVRPGAYRVMPLIAPSEDGLALDVVLERRPGRRGSRVGGAVHGIRRAMGTRARVDHLLFSLMKRARRRNGRRVLFVSGGATAIGGNLKVVRDRMVERGLDREYDLRTTLRKDPGRQPTHLKDLSIRWSLAGADVILVDGSRPRTLHEVDLESDVRVIQLWHASGAFKAVGYSRVGRKRGSDPWSRKHKNYTHVIVSSERDVLFYAEAFGIPEDRVVATGIPRMDRFFDERLQASGRAAALAAYPEADGRMTILFAPTYRRGADWGCEYPLERIDYAALHAVCVEKDAVAIIRMHPFARTDLKIPDAYRDRLLDGLRSAVDVNDLLLLVDLLITDYSSILFEFSTLRRPMLFYAFDLDEFADLRDLYVPFESFVPGRIVRTFPELVDAIRRDDHEIEKVADFAERHFAYLDAGSTDRVIDRLILAR
jgi:CDP-ribitol ribitolphosphotransferase